MAKEKSHFSRKSTHFQFKHDFDTTSALARFEPAIERFFNFYFSTGQRLNKEKRSQEPTKRFFPHTPPRLINATHSLVKMNMD